MRDNLWLNQRLNQIWELLFPDLVKPNKVLIRFKGKSRTKFGHIKMLKDKSTEIAINSLFRSQLIPEYILDLTIAHELVHYSHGFHSPLPRLHKHPHRGNVVEKELIVKGFRHLIMKEKVFVKNEWPMLYQTLTSNSVRQRHKSSLLRIFRF